MPYFGRVNIYYLGALLLFANSALAIEYVDDFRIKNFSKPESQTNPMVCMDFNYELDSKYPHQEDFVVLEAVRQNGRKFEHPVSIHTNGDQFCLRELNFGTSYELTFRDGLPLFRNQIVGKPYVYRFKIEDREPQFKFQTATYILPTNQQASVPVEVINIESTELSVYRLSPEQVKDSMQSEAFFETYRGWDLDRIQSNAEYIGTAELAWELERNKTKHINLDLSSFLSEQKAGAYIVHAKTDKDRWSDQDVQTLIYTDVGLTSYQGIDGLSVYARSYQTGLPLSDVNVELIAKNHDVLATERTNELGKVFFENALMQGKHGHAPVQIRHLNDTGDYAVLSLIGQELDVSDRPVSGAKPLGLMNAYMFSERGVYRLGEKLVLTGIVRDKSLTAVGNIPLTLKLLRPNGDVAVTRSIYALNHGGFQERMTIPSSGRTGQWKLALYMNVNEAPVGELSVEVADYVPETIKVVLKSVANKYINDPTTVSVSSDFLYGAPASGLDVESETVVVQKRRLFDDYSGYVFGTAEPFSADVTKLDVSETDESGQAIIKIPSNLLQSSWQQQALEMKLRVKVKEPSNRVVSRFISMPAVQLPSWVGIKTDENYPVYDREKPVLFNVVNITSEQQPVAGSELRYTLIEEDWDYHWYYNDSQWRYKVSKFDHRIVKTGSIISGDDGTSLIDFGVLDWGRYRLEVTDINSNQTTQLAFRNGWWNADGSQSAMPDNVKLAPSVNKLKVGESLSLKIKSPYSGQLHLLIANDHIIEERVINLQNGEAELNLEAKKDWEQGVYVLATVYRPGNNNVGPARAIGITHVQVNRPELTAQVIIKSQAKVRPNETVQVEVSTDLPEGSPIVLAAVDEGILQLTNYQTPDPAKWFLKKRRLGVGIRDLYGHLIHHKEGELLKLRFGGDADTGAPTAPPLETFVKPVAIVSDLVAVDKEGNAQIDMTFPQFNGQVRLMAIAFDDLAMGAASEQMIVRYPLVVQPTLPRFLAQGDVAEIGVSLHNIELDDHQQISIEWQATDGIFINDSEAAISLSKGERQTVKASIKANDVGSNRVGLVVHVKGKKPQVYTWDMTVLQNRFIETHYNQALVESGERKTLISLVGELEPASRQLKVTATDRPTFDTDWLSDSLSRYPFGCLEQTTSKAWPLLVLNGAVSQDEDEEALRRRLHINKAIEHLAAMQLYDGSFSLWRGGNRSQEWLSMYATEFLMEAKEYGYTVPQHLYDNATNYVNGYRGKSESAIAYSYYLKARMGTLDAGDLRYFVSKVLRYQYRPQVYSHLLLTANMMGQYEFLDKLLDEVTITRSSYWYRDDYSSYLRDSAMLISSLLVIGDKDSSVRDKAFGKVEQLFKEAQEKSWLSTQEKAWLIRLADQMGEAKTLSSSLPISIDFQTMMLGDAANYLVNQNNWSTFKNTSTEPMYLSITASGINEDLAPASSLNGVAIKTTYTDMNTGENIVLEKVRVGTEVLVSHQIALTTGTDVELSLEAPVPAGFELENPRLTGLRSEVAELGRIEPTFEEFRDDRYMAAWSLARGYRSLLHDGESTISYVMRAVTPGEFLVPSAVVEDMYRPENRANTAEGKVIILPK